MTNVSRPTTTRKTTTTKKNPAKGSRNARALREWNSIGGKLLKADRRKFYEARDVAIAIAIGRMLDIPTRVVVGRPEDFVPATEEK